MELHGETKCKVCGTYTAGESFLRELYTRQLYQNPDPEVSYLLSGVVREKAETGIVPNLQSLDEIQAQIPFRNDPFASIDRLLTYLYRKSKSSAKFSKIDALTDYPICYARNPGEFYFFLEKALELGYIDTRPMGTISEVGEYRLSLNGWRRIAELRLEQSDSRQAFVAM